MRVNKYVLFVLLLGINCVYSLNLRPSALVKTIHKGAYEAVKGTVNTVTEVVGTPVDIKDVHFFLHTSRDHGYPNHTVDPLQPSELASKGRVYFLIHGWTQSREKTPWYKPLTEYLLKKHPDAHVVQIDWGKAAANNYASAAFCTESVGNIIGDAIKKLVVENGVPRENIILIGHSLGGQITGWVGKRFRKLTKTTLPRIIALDPAGPLFSSRPEDKRLNKHDADIVMVLHSDGGKLGFGSSCGSIDFFPNGGSDQPGCYKVDLANVATLTEPIWCDHQRGYDLFLEAVKSPCLFLASKCENYDKFKEDKCEDLAVSLGDLEASFSGSYFFKTTDKAPFIEKEELKRNAKIFERANKNRDHKLQECSELLNNKGQHDSNLEKPTGFHGSTEKKSSRIDDNYNTEKQNAYSNAHEDKRGIQNSEFNEDHEYKRNLSNENKEQRKIGGTNHGTAQHSVSSNRNKDEVNINDFRKRNEKNHKVSQDSIEQHFDKDEEQRAKENISNLDKNYRKYLDEDKVSIKSVSSGEFKKIP